MTKQEREKQIKAKYSEPTPKDNHTHTHCKQFTYRINQYHPVARNTKPCHRQTQTKCTQDGNMTKKRGYQVKAK